MAQTLRSPLVDGVAHGTVRVLTRGMRSVIAVMVALALVGSFARADSPAPDDRTTAVNTRDVVRSAARSSHRNRILGGIGMFVVGAVTLPVGILMARDSTPSGQFNNVGDVERGFGYGFIGFSGVVMLTGTIIALGTSPEERIAQDLESAESVGQLEAGARRARLDAAMWANRVEHQRRTTERYVGAGILAAGLGGLAAIKYAPVEIRSTSGALLIFGTLSAVIAGPMVLAGSMIERPIEKVNRQVNEQPALTAGIVPTRGGVMAGVGLTF